MNEMCRLRAGRPHVLDIICGPFIAPAFAGKRRIAVVTLIAGGFLYLYA